jgi:hypothetical protein
VLNILPVGDTQNVEATPPPPAHYYNIASENTSLFCLIVSLSAASETISEIERTIESEPTEDRPVQPVAEAAIKIIKDADAHSLIFLPASEIESFEGSLLVHWELRQKRVTLIAGPGAYLKLYKKGNSSLSELIPNPTPVELTAAIHSVMQ